MEGDDEDQTLVSEIHVVKAVFSTSSEVSCRAINSSNSDNKICTDLMEC